MGDDGRVRRRRLPRLRDCTLGALVATAYLVTGDRGIAEDCVQESLARVHRHWPRLAADGAPEAYARRAAINAALSWRRRRREREVPLADAGDPRGRAELSGELDADLMTALRALPPRMRAVVALRYVEDRSEAETADMQRAGGHRHDHD